MCCAAWSRGLAAGCMLLEVWQSLHTRDNIEGHCAIQHNGVLTLRRDLDAGWAKHRVVAHWYYHDFEWTLSMFNKWLIEIGGPVACLQPAPPCFLWFGSFRSEGNVREAKAWQVRAFAWWPEWHCLDACIMHQNALTSCSICWWLSSGLRGWEFRAKFLFIQ